MEQAETKSIKRIVAFFRTNGINFSDVDITKSKLKGEGPILTLTVDLKSVTKKEFTQLLEENDDVIYFEEL
ncbi:MAG: hypothetical protein VZR00_09775 [Lachnospiraceae bacterium]|jgi:hypothetical protein|nr:hypothetical protein [Lachnospiraceae bacterium]